MVAIQGLALPRGECQVFGILDSLEGFLGSPLHILCHERYDSLSLSVSSQFPTLEWPRPSGRLVGCLTAS